MDIKNIDFVGSFEKNEQCPKDGLPEYAFIGRSNVGKSSLINALAGRKEIARTSSTPGKTQTLNFYRVNDDWYLVDLPGYGYARSSKSSRKSWKLMIENYLQFRKSLACVFVLLDARHQLQENDRRFLDWVGEHGIPFALIYTKIDKVKKSQRDRHINQIRDDLLPYWESLPPQFVTSAETSEGTAEILDFIHRINNN